MISAISGNYPAKLYSGTVKSGTAQQSGTSNGFLDMMARTVKNGTDTVEISKTRESTATATSSADADTKVDEYRKYLNAKYGNVTIQSVSKDQKTLDRIGGQMRGNDVIIAPNILEKMANDQEKAIYYEKKIDDFFAATPRLKSYFAAQGLTYEPCGVVIHEDGSVTYICGGGDSPERVAEVNRINREKQAKKAAQQRMWAKQSQEAALQHRRLMEQTIYTQALKDDPDDRVFVISQPAQDTTPSSMTTIQGGMFL